MRKLSISWFSIVLDSVKENAHVCFENSQEVRFRFFYLVLRKMHMSVSLFVNNHQTQGAYF